jgi:aminopeptidase N
VRGQRSLLRTEAERRATQIRVLDMRVDLDLNGDPAGESESKGAEGAGFTSTTTLHFAAEDSALRSASDVFVDFAGTQLHSATLNDRPLDPATWQDRRVPLPDLEASNTLVVEGTMAYSNDGEGLHRHVDPADGLTYLYAMSFLDAAPRWFACFDQPDLKAPYEFRVKAPVDWIVAGNGPSEHLGPGHWRLVSRLPLSTYFVTLVAGPYASISAHHDGIALSLLARRSLRPVLEAEAADIFAVTAQSFDYYHRMFGSRYPLGHYHQAFVPDFNAGAMENPGCITLRDSYLFRGRATRADRASRAGIVAHEMAHQWFGDLVTMRWWDDLWLNESFAEYMAHRCCTEATSYPLWTEFGIQRKQWGSAADQAPSAHPVAASDSVDAASALQNFDGISYAKGAAVLRQMVAYLGEDTFLEGLRAYMQRYAFGNAQFADLIQCWTEAGARDLPGWAEQWLRTAGMDTLDVVLSDGGPRVLRRAPTCHPGTRTHAVEVAALAADGREVDRVPVLVADEPRPLDLPPATLLVPDAGDVTWAKIRFGPDGWRRVGAALHARDPATRVVAYNAIRDAVRDAELSPSAALDLVRQALPYEAEDVVVSAILTFARSSLAGSYCAIPRRGTRLAQVHTLVRRLLDEAPVGSDRQLLAFRGTVTSSADPQELLAWRHGRQLPEDLTLDPELIWVLVERISALSGDVREIERAEATDPSAAGQEHAARARAARPDPAAKERAWRLLTRPSSASAYQLYATAEGFFLPHQSDLTASYAHRYFDEFPSTAAFREGWVLGRVATLAFPVTLATAEVLEHADETLARTDLAPPLRRALSDGTDELRRAYRASRLPGEQ